MIPITPAAGMGLGGTLGGLLGQAGDIMAAPRRGLWSMLGAPFGFTNDDIQSGTSLLGAMGMDKEDPWTHALGLGLEVAGDPLTYAGGILGRLGAVAPGARLAEEAGQVANLGREAASVAGGHAAEVAANQARQLERFGEMQKFIDPSAIVRGDIAKTYARVEPELAGKLEGLGMGHATETGGMTLNAGFHPELTAGGEPWLSGGANPTMKGNLPGFLEPRMGRSKYTMVQSEGVPLPTSGPSPEELALLRRTGVGMAQELPPELRNISMQSIHNPLSGPDIFREAAMQRAAQTAPASPMFRGLPAYDYLATAQDELANIAAKQGALNQMMRGASPYYAAAGLGGAAGLGYGVGNYAFGRQ